MSSDHARLGVELHSIDRVPDAQRYGTPLRLFTIWLSINLSILCLTVGKLGVAAGLSFAWTALAVVVGNAVGTIFMAAHSTQGPHLGIPQMVQTRAQFGVLGAALPLVAVVATFTLFTTANAIVLREPLKALMPLGNEGVLIVFGLVTLLIAFIGYELIHRMGALLSILSAALFVAATVVLLLRPETHAAAAPIHTSSFQSAAFLLTLTQAAAWSLSFAPYVADYSRYLPADTSTWKTFWFTGLGNFVGATSIMIFGAFVAAMHPAIAADPGTGLASLFGSGGPLVRLLIIVGVLEGNVMNLYSAYMSTITMFTGFHQQSRASLWVKFVSMLILVAIATLIALLAQNNFEAYFTDMLSALIYMVVPWSAVNLADYYLVRRGRYVVGDLFKVDGIYGRYKWTGIVAYLISIVVQIPFMSFSFYSGSIERMIGADVAWIPGLVVPAVLYCVLEKRFLAGHPDHL
jgi:nucleobase:cation symporter-1, NCS1 family